MNPYEASTSLSVPFSYKSKIQQENQSGAHKKHWLISLWKKLSFLFFPIQTKISSDIYAAHAGADNTHELKP